VYEYIMTIFMPTSIHIPKPLLAAVDRRARALRVSRNRLIVRALEREVRSTEWSDGFFQKLATVDDATSAAVDEVLEAIVEARRSKKPPLL
jgi:metal-responsive CopG/Arc/MetJ family transcriptional regulator